MGNHRPILTKCWEKFLAYKGFKLTRIKASHHQWTKRGVIRPIPVWGDEKDVPAIHLRTGCKTIGCSVQEMYKWVEENC